MSKASQFRFDPDKPQVLEKPAAVTHKMSSARSAMKEKHFTTIPEGGPFTPDTISISSKASFKLDKTRPKRVPTVEKTIEESGERRSQWEILMRQFSEDVKVRKKCRLSPMDYFSRGRSTQHFITGSSYTGTWNILGMNGHGVFTFPSGVIYEGEFFDSCFHGEGMLKYPNGVKLIGKWEHGVLKNKTLVFDDGIEYEEEGWKYCQMPDRRFKIEHETALNPGTESFMTADQPTKPVPPGYYDTGDGFMYPPTNGVFKYTCISDAVRFLSTKEKEWVMEHCRTNPESHVGPKDSLYERWTDPTQPDDVSEGPTQAEDYAAAAWARMSLVTSFGRKPFIKFDPQADAEMNDDNENDEKKETLNSNLHQTDNEDATSQTNSHT